MKTFEFEVTQRIKVQIDEAKFTPEMMEEFNRCISDFGTDEYAFERHGEHIAQLAGRGYEEFLPSDSVEGYGPIREAGIKVEILEDHFQIDRVGAP
ncbi:DUF2528 family protein [Neorhizobium sp. T786]|uniref:DUF2528 family protein n=1 Tax=Pseudorhizobium xiangyangii TaxID=2883104 RepID=UPI001CFFC62E|nr:DUF2528 family protein [Neorhizobium xiangyangii]MCB5204225.1 DUF2528 family protein [Neorhizobium xiangyangii]